QEALREIKTPAQAEQVAEQVADAASGATEREVREQGGASPEPGQTVQAATQAAPEGAKAPTALVEAAKQVAGSSGETREGPERAVQQATSPEQHGAVAPETQEPLELLRTAILAHMKPYQALDARLFLAINHLPHKPLGNRLMSAFTLIMTF